MGKFTKVTTGFVKQYFEPGPSGEFVCVGQEFIAGDQVEYVDAMNDPIVPPDYEYQSYDMSKKEF